MDYTSIILLVAGFSLIVLVHELGHFLAARYVGIRVEQFALGFGQALFSWRKGLGLRAGSSEKEYQRRIAQRAAAKVSAENEAEGKTEPTAAQIQAATNELGISETEYRFNWIPLGGYVKMMGQDDTKPGLVVADPQSYTSKTVGQRMLVISAGVIMNIIFGLIAFMILFFTGLEVPKAVVGAVLPMSPAQMAVRADGSSAPLQVGDEIVAIDGVPQHNDFRKIALNTALSEAGQPLKVQVKRTNGQLEDLSITPAQADMGQIRLLGIGIEIPRLLELTATERQKAFRGELEKIPAERRPVGWGERITAVEGEPVERNESYKLDRALQKSDGRPVSITVTSPDGKSHDATVQPELMRPFGDIPLNFAGMLPRTVIAAVGESSSGHGKLQADDVVIAIDVAGDVKRDPTEAEFRKIVQEAGARGTPLTFTVLRDGKEVVISGLEANKRLDTKGSRGLGVGITSDVDHTVIGGTMADSPAAQIPAGSAITSVNGQTVASWNDVLRELRKADAQKPVTVAAQQPTGVASTYQLSLRPADVKLLQSLRYDSDIVLSTMTGSRSTRNPLEAAWWGVQETRDSILQVYVTLRRLVQGSVPVSGMMGPVGMFQQGTKVASQGLDYLLWFLAIISANLAVVNFLPIPVVDGGHFLFLIIEKIKGRPVSEKAMMVAQYVGLALIGTMFIFVTYQDILRLLTVH